jgi:hypothetical protein
VGTLVLDIARWLEPLSPHPHECITNDHKHSVFAQRTHTAQLSGNGRITGTVRLNGALTRRRVTLFRRADLFVLKQEWSDPDTGEYSFDGLAAGALSLG